MTEKNTLFGIATLLERDANDCIKEFLEDGGDIQREWYSNNTKNQKTRFLHAWLSWFSWLYEVSGIEIGIIVLLKLK